MPYLPAILAATFVLTTLLVWMIRAARELSQRNRELSLADKQLALYGLLHTKARDSVEAQRTLEQVELSQTIYQNVAAEYNHCIGKPQNRLVAYVLGYCPAPEVNTK